MTGNDPDRRDGRRHWVRSRRRARKFNNGNGTSSSCRQKWTSDLLLSIPNLKGVLPLGDILDNECADASSLANSYGPSWGRLKGITYWATGNHEYGRACARNDNTPAVNYFNPPNPKGWDSYDIGKWDLIALDSECSYGLGTNAVGGCGTGDSRRTTGSVKTLRPIGTSAPSPIGTSRASRPASMATPSR